MVEKSALFTLSVIGERYLLIYVCNPVDDWEVGYTYDRLVTTVKYLVSCEECSLYAFGLALGMSKDYFSEVRVLKVVNGW